MKQTGLTYYQATEYSDDGTNINFGGVPEELCSFHVFPTRKICETWLELNGYDPKDFSISEYHDDDIEEATFIDEFGEPLDELDLLPYIKEGNNVETVYCIDCEVRDRHTDDTHFLLDNKVWRDKEKALARFNESAEETKTEFINRHGEDDTEIEEHEGYLMVFTSGYDDYVEMKLIESIIE